MLCSICNKNKATIHYKTVTNGVAKEMHLCSECAGEMGIGDKHIDLFWGAWTLEFNLKTSKFKDRFFDAYGRNNVDLEIVELVGAIECFG